MTDQEAEKLFQKHRDGTLTDQEKVMLESWYLKIARSSNHETHIEDLEKRIEDIWNGLPVNVRKAASGEKRAGSMVFFGGYGRIAASIVFILAISVFAYWQRESVSSFFRLQSVSMLESATANGERVRITLSDGTLVWMNAASKLKYPVKFTGNIRNVFLSGEAYFDVASNPEKPFIIHTGEVDVQVLGTSFNVNAYEDDQFIEVSVMEGKVNVAPVGQETQAAVLTSHQQTRYDRNTQSLKTFHTDNVAQSIAWTEGRLVYSNDPLSEIIPELERTYDVSIDANSEILSCAVYVEFVNEPVEKVLKVLAELLNGSVTNEGTTYRLRGKDCHG